jgi:hypothetical protein
MGGGRSVVEKRKGERYSVRLRCQPSPLGLLYNLLSFRAAHLSP